MADVTSANPGQNWAFALVHGIGTTQPMPLIEEITKALKSARPGLELAGPVEAHQLSERRQYVQHAHIPGGSARFAAMHWSDISFYKEGILNLIGGLMLTSFGARFFSESAADDGNILATSLHRVLQLIVLIIAYFVFPFTLVSLIYSVMALLAENLFQYDLLYLQDRVIIASSVLIAFILFWIGRSRALPMQGERPLAVPIFWAILIYALLIAALMIAGHIDASWQFSMNPKRDGIVATALANVMQWSGDLIGYKFWSPRVDSLDRIGIYFGFFHWLQTVVAFILIGLTTLSLLLVAIEYPIARLTRGRGYSLVLATVAVISIWIANLVVLWPENLATTSAMTTYSRAVYQKNDPACQDPKRVCKDIELNVFNPKTLSFQSQKNVIADDLPKVPDKARNLNTYYPLLWFEAAFIAFMIVLGVSGMLLIAIRFLWSSWARFRKLDKFRVLGAAWEPRRSNWPRLIVSDIYVFAVVLLMALTALILFAQLFHQDVNLAKAALSLLGGDPSSVPDPLPAELPVPFEFVKLGVIASVVLTVLAATYIRDITKLILDVVNHFTAPALDFPVRKRIEQRFWDTIEFLMEPNDKPNLVVVAHSQGTVITFDALVNGLWDKVADRVSSLTILTFGSPLTHIYQRYFSRLYPRLAETRLKALADEPRFKWVNVYRVDDFVGTFVENSVSGLPVNVPLPPGGHTAYWQRKAFEQLFTEPPMATILPTAAK